MGLAVGPIRGVLGVLDGLESGTTYQVRARARNLIGLWSEWSTTVSAPTDALQIGGGGNNDPEPTDRLTAMVNAMSGIDIGGMGFSPSRFPGLEEDAHIVGGRLLANVTDTVNLNVFFGQVVTGNNTAASRIFGTGIGFGFGGGGGFDF